MGIMVVARRQACPGQGDALATAIVRLVGGPSSWPVGLDTVQVFRHEDDPNQFLSLSAWASHEAYRASTAEAAATQLDGLSAAPVARYFFRPWVSYQMPGARATAIEAAILSYTREQTESVYLFVLREATRRLRGTPGFCYRQLFRDLEAANRLLVVLGWDSPTTLEAFRRDVRPTFEERQPPAGVTMDHFVGILDIDLQRAGHSLAS